MHCCDKMVKSVGDGPSDIDSNDADSRDCVTSMQVAKVHEEPMENFLAKDMEQESTISPFISHGSAETGQKIDAKKRLVVVMKTNTDIEEKLKKSSCSSQVESDRKACDIRRNESAADINESSSFCAKETSLVTAAMIKEEANLREEGEIESARLRQEALNHWQEISEDIRLTQLNHLLEKSSIYANYLLDVIEKNKEKKRRKALKKKQKKHEGVDNKENIATLSSSANARINFGSRKRKSDATVPVPCKRPSRISARRQQKADEDEDDSTSRPPADLAVGQKVQVVKKQRNGEEDLVTAKVTDSCYINDEWKFRVHYMGTSKKNDEWVKRSAVAADIDDDPESDDEARNRKHTKTSDIDKREIKIDTEALFKAKLYEGVSSPSNIEIIDGVRYLNGEAIPEAQPVLFTGGVLRNYQVTGYEWLNILFSNAVNGILADEMGLGKTIQCIALICRLVKLGFHGPFMVCAPMSTICNWIAEFKRFAPSLAVMLYHGTADERKVLSGKISERSSELQHCPVVVTSYEVLMRDRLLLSKHTWEYLVVDEGHRLKNMNCRLLKELKMLKVNAKLLLTGTPLQNDLSELWSLLNFLLPEVFNDLGTFEAWFDLSKIQKGAQSMTSEKEKYVVKMLHKILAPFLLRRTKDDVDIALPPKRELLVFAPLSPSQNDLYQALATRTIRKFLTKESDCGRNESSFLTESQERKTRSATAIARCALEREQRHVVDDESEVTYTLNNMMMQLRKCCNHPYLIRYPLIPGTDYYRIDEELVTSCGKVQLLDRMLPLLRQAGHKVLIFSQMTKLLDIIEDYCRFRDFTFVRLDGRTRCETRQRYIDQYNADPDLFIFLLSTRAGGLGINLTAADTVIIYDSDWNPQNDLQAQDRCHRIGQTRPVIVYRIVSAGTVDQFMVERAEAKRVLEKLIMNRSRFKGKLAEDIKSDDEVTSVSTKMLTMLQKSSGAEERCKPVTEEDLHKILDRETVMSCSAEDLGCGLFRAVD